VRGAIDLVMQVRKVGFKEAVNALEAFRGTGGSPVALPARQSLTEAAVLSENPPFKGTYEKCYVPSEWLTKRGILPATLKKFGLGQYYSPKRLSVYKGKILLPVGRYEDGELVAWRGAIVLRLPSPSGPDGWRSCATRFRSTVVGDSFIRSGA
jgi:hypothetical protein